MAEAESLNPSSKLAAQDGSGLPTETPTLIEILEIVVVNSIYVFFWKSAENIPVYPTYCEKSDETL
ncbi:hypothetical protein VTI28DRAFT_9505 [Corynascus sepedonium]